MAFSELKEFLANIPSGDTVKLAAKKAVTDPHFFDDLFEVSKSGEQPYAWRASWVLDHASESDPALLLPYIDAVYDLIPGLTNDGLKRHFLKFILRCPINPNKAGVLIDILIGWMLSPGEAVSTRVLGMDILVELCKLEPDLRFEVRSVIYDLQEKFPTPGMKIRLKKALKTIDVIEKSIEIK
jgi:hypothetical protein